MKKDEIKLILVEFQEVLKNLVKDQGVANSESPGKHVPVRALAYTLLDDQYKGKTCRVVIFY